jgi:hypothetical protein
MPISLPPLHKEPAIPSRMFAANTNVCHLHDSEVRVEVIFSNTRMLIS